MQRLKTRPQFQAALAGGTVSRTSHFALHRLTLVPRATQSPGINNPDGPVLSPEQALFGVVDVWFAEHERSDFSRFGVYHPKGEHIWSDTLQRFREVAMHPEHAPVVPHLDAICACLTLLGVPE